MMKWNAWGGPEAAKPLSDGIRSLLKPAVDARRGLSFDGAASTLLRSSAPTAYADGDFVCPLPVEVSAVSGALQILCPI